MSVAILKCTWEKSDLGHIICNIGCLRTYKQMREQKTKVVKRVKYSFRNSIRESKAYQDRQNLDPDLDPNCLSSSLEQIRTDILSVLNWVQTVCRGYQQLTKVSGYNHCHGNKDIRYAFFQK